MVKRNDILRKRAAKNTRAIAVTIFKYLFLSATGYVVLYPLIFMISYSVRPSEAFIDPSVVWVSKSFSFENFKLAADALKLPTALISTLSIEIVSALIQVLTCAVTAYGFGRFNFPGKRFFTVVLLLMILIPSPMIIIPQTLNYRTLHILNTPLTFYLPSLFSVGLKSGILIYIYIQFFKGLPKELEEAAWIDGAGTLRTFFSVIVPSAGVVILTVSIFSVIWHWNDYYIAIMNLPNNYPLAVSLSQIISSLEKMNYWITADPQTQGIVMAACIIFTAPVLAVYLVLQKWFIASIDRIGIVG